LHKLNFTMPCFVVEIGIAIDDAEHFDELL
jgi:hypothetical protein